MPEYWDNIRIQHLHGTEADWRKIQGAFIPEAGELIIYDADNVYGKPRVKIGDGVTNLELLPFLMEYSKSPEFDLSIVGPYAADSGKQTAFQLIARFKDEDEADRIRVFGSKTDSQQEDNLATLRNIADEEIKTTYDYYVKALGIDDNTYTQVFNDCCSGNSYRVSVGAVTASQFKSTSSETTKSITTSQLPQPCTQSNGMWEIPTNRADYELPQNSTFKVWVKWNNYVNPLLTKISYETTTEGGYKEKVFADATDQKYYASARWDYSTSSWVNNIGEPNSPPVSSDVPQYIVGDICTDTTYQEILDRNSEHWGRWLMSTYPMNSSADGYWQFLNNIIVYDKSITDSMPDGWEVYWELDPTRSNGYTELYAYVNSVGTDYTVSLVLINNTGSKEIYNSSSGWDQAFKNLKVYIRNTNNKNMDQAMYKWLWTNCKKLS